MEHKGAEQLILHRTGYTHRQKKAGKEQVDHETGYTHNGRENYTQNYTAEKSMESILWTL